MAEIPAIQSSFNYRSGESLDFQSCNALDVLAITVHDHELKLDDLHRANPRCFVKYFLKTDSLASRASIKFGEYLHTVGFNIEMVKVNSDQLEYLADNHHHKDINLPDAHKKIYDAIKFRSHLPHGAYPSLVLTEGGDGAYNTFLNLKADYDHLLKHFEEYRDRGTENTDTISLLQHSTIHLQGIPWQAIFIPSLLFIS